MGCVSDCQVMRWKLWCGFYVQFLFIAKQKIKLVNIEISKIQSPQLHKLENIEILKHFGVGPCGSIYCVLNCDRSGSILGKMQNFVLFPSCFGIQGSSEDLTFNNKTYVREHVN